MPTQAKGWAGLNASWGPRTRGLSICSHSDLGLPGHRPQKGQGPSRLHGASSYLQTETGRSEVAVAKVAPGPLPHSHSILSSPSPSPHGFLFPSPHRSPTSHCPASSLWTPRKVPHSDPEPHSCWPVGPLLLFAPRTPSVGAHRAAPSHRGPAHPGLHKAHSHSSQFPFVLGKAPAPILLPCCPSLPKGGFSGCPPPSQGARESGVLRRNLQRLGTLGGMILCSRPWPPLSSS